MNRRAGTGILHDSGNHRSDEIMILINIIDLYSLVVFVAVILSWVQLPHDNPVAQFVNSMTEPLLGPIRRALPAMGGLDFSPMILLVGLQILKGFLIESIR